MRPVLSLFSDAFCAHQIRKAGKAYPYRTSEYVGVVGWGLYGPSERMRKEEFLRPVPVSFEGHRFWAMSCWDSYLHSLFGDYSQLPPPEKRTGGHDLTAWRVEE